MSEWSSFWTNTSVLQFAGGTDPIRAITEHARKVVLEAMDSGWDGPPCEVLPVVKTGFGSKYVKAGAGGRPVVVGGSRSKPAEPAD